MNKKYELLKDDFIEYNGRVLYRIKALKDFDDIKIGDIGGYIESEDRLSHEDNCWVYNDAKVFDYARVFGNAKIFDNSEIYGFAEVYNYAKVYENAKVCNSAEIYENAKIYGNAKVHGRAYVYGDAKINKGNIIGKVSLPYKNIFQHQCEERMLTAILTEDDEILYTIGCKDNITEEKFIEKIHNEDGGLEENPHREEYLKLIPSINMYLKGE